MRDHRNRETSVCIDGESVGQLEGLERLGYCAERRDRSFGVVRFAQEMINSVLTNRLMTHTTSGIVLCAKHGKERWWKGGKRIDYLIRCADGDGILCNCQSILKLGYQYSF